MNVGEIALRVKRTFGDEAGAQITDADIMRWVNDAQREIAFNNDLLQTTATTATVVGKDQYTLPPDVLTMRSVRYGGRTLSYLSPEEAAKLIGTDSTATGTPTHYSVWARNIDLYPAPDAADPDDLQLYYTRQPAVVTTTSQEPELPLKYHNRIVEYCIAQAYELDDNMDSYRQKMQQFQDGVEKIKGSEEWQAQDVYPSISVSVHDYWGE